jgi:mono/diheme cytochrome c family protein
MRRRFANLVLPGLLALAVLAMSPLSRAAEDTGEGAGAEEQQVTPEQRAALAATGRKLAEERCQRCHAIDQTSASPNTAAPPFRELSDKWPPEDLEEALAEGIVTGHEEMPEFVFTTDEITAFIEFLDTLQPTQPQPQ